jgi:hypothetical protein
VSYFAFWWHESYQTQNFLLWHTWNKDDDNDDDQNKNNKNKNNNNNNNNNNNDIFLKVILRILEGFHSLPTPVLRYFLK